MTHPVLECLANQLGQEQLLAGQDVMAAQLVSDAYETMAWWHVIFSFDYSMVKLWQR